MTRKTEGCRCPHCMQTSSRYWNLKIHIKRRHNDRGHPRDAVDPSYSTPNTFSPPDGKNYSYDKHYDDHVASSVPVKSDEQLFDYERLLYLRTQNEWLRELVTRDNLLKQISNSIQQPAILSGGTFLPMAFPKVNLSTPQNNAANNITPIGFCSYLCESCLWSIVLPISPSDFLKMKYSVKVEHTMCSDEDIGKINLLIEQKKIVDLPTKVKESRGILLDLLTETVSSWIGDGEVCLLAVEPPSKLFSEEFGGNKTNNSRSSSELTFPWTEGNYVDLGYVRKNHWAYRLIKQENKKMIINKNQLREFLNITNSTMRAFKAHMDDSVATRYFYILCLSTAWLSEAAYK